MKSDAPIRTHRLCEYHEKCTQKDSCRHAQIHTHNTGEHVSVNCGFNKKAKWHDGKGYCNKVD